MLPARDGWPGTGYGPLRTAETRCRERRVCYRKHALRDGFSSRKTDLNQFIDTATRSRACSGAAPVDIATTRAPRFGARSLTAGFRQ